MKLPCRRFRRRRYAPDRVADVVGDQKRALLVEPDTDGAALRLALVVEEAGQHVLRRPRRLAVLEWNEDHLVAGAGLAIPRAVLADEGAIFHLGRKQIAGVEGQPERSRMRAERVIRSHRLLHQVGPLWLDACVDMISVIAVRPAIERA